MAVIYTDAEIAALIAEPKPVTQRQGNFITRKLNRYETATINVLGDAGNDFRVIFRRNRRNPSDFSIVLAVQPVQGGPLFHLRRYDGRHWHTNHLESTRRNKDRFYDFHIHTATERYQESDSPDEGYAEVTDRYHDMDGAIKYMADDAELYSTS